MQAIPHNLLVKFGRWAIHRQCESKRQAADALRYWKSRSDFPLRIAPATEQADPLYLVTFHPFGKPERKTTRVLSGENVETVYNQFKASNPGMACSIE